LWIVVGVVVLLLLALVGSCALFLRDLSTQFAPAASVINVSRGQIDSFRVNTFNGRTTIIFQAAQGVDATDGPDLACRIVKPTLANTSAAGTAWVIVNRAGDAIASNETPCP